MELLRRSRIPGNPIELGPVRLDEKKERRALDVESGKDLFAGDSAADGPIKNEMIAENFGVRRIFIVLLTQQYAVPSAGLGEKVDEQGLSLGFGFGQGVVERARDPVLGRENDGDYEQQE
jgi:hypothetical protein